MIETIDPTVALAFEHLLYHGYDESHVTGFPNPGSWLIFGIVLVPIYVMLGAWFLGEPRNTSVATMGVVYLVGLTTVLWIAMLVQTLLIGVMFF